MKALTAFLPWVEPHVLGAPQPLILQAIRDSCIELCERSNIVQTIETQDAVEGLAEYDIAAPTQQRLATVVAVTYLDRKLAPVAADMVGTGSALRAGVDSVVTSMRGTPTAFYQRTPTDAAFYLWPVPGTTVPGALAVRASFSPTRAATQVEDVLFDDWLATVVSGALAQLHALPDQVFSNAKAAERHAVAAQAGVMSAVAEARTGSTRGSLHVRGRRFV